VAGEATWKKQRGGGGGGGGRERHEVVGIVRALRQRGEDEIDGIDSVEKGWSNGGGKKEMCAMWKGRRRRESIWLQWGKRCINFP
jgi:hypothetical protein